MMTSSRPRGDVGNSFANRRGHATQLSISDPSHHVTDVIGNLYGDDDDVANEGARPLSFIPGAAYQDQIQRGQPQQDPNFGEHRRPLMRSVTERPTISSPLNSDNGQIKKAQTLPVRSASQRSKAYEPGSPTLSLRDVQDDPASSQFALTNIDNPSDIAQELSNLQALRRMSMDVGNSIDPDLPPLSLSAMPAIAPSGGDDENDPSRLLWVPARVHPELAPTEFKSFLENRVQSIRRRSGDSFISADGETSGSDSGSLSPGSLASGSLRRKKSMLSRQIDNSGGRAAAGYVDGAERLERQRSGHNRELSLEDLVNNPSKVVQKLTQESQNQPSGPEGNSEDMPILPVGPGMGLRRSTRTTYRKGGSLRSGEKVTLSRRAAHRSQDAESPEPSPPIEAPKGHGLTRVQSEPIAENYSRPTRSVRRQNHFSQESPAALAALDGSSQDSGQSRATSPPQVQQDQLPVRATPSSRAQDAPAQEPVSPEQATERQDNQHPSGFQSPSSQDPTSQTEPTSEPPADGPPARSNRRPLGTPLVNRPPPPQQQYTSKTAQQSQQAAENDSLAANLGSGSTRTDALTFIPTFNQEEKKVDKKSKKDRDDESIGSSTGKSGSAWKWFKGGEDKEKKKDESKKSKTKALVEKAQDNVRLDVIQTSIDKTAPKARESIVLDRDQIDNKLQEERKRETTRRSDSKREKDGNIFSSIFGGSKKKEEKERDRSSKKSQQFLEVPEDPPYKPLEPDVDYHWSRFPLLEERAIYRMAHIKLANPRRPLHSQVLLSNFMYSYLAIVQAMHPQMNVPLSPQQKRLEEEARRKKQEEEYLSRQMEDGDDGRQDLDQYNFDYHRATVQYADSGHEVNYVDEAQIYEDEHGNSQRRHDDEQENAYGYDGSEGYGQGAKEYYQYHNGGGHPRHDGQGDMW